MATVGFAIAAGAGYAGLAGAGQTLVATSSVYFAAMIGATAGAIVDSAFIFPHLFGKKRQRGSIGDIPLAIGVEGSPVEYCLGPQNRVPGMPIWISDIKTVPREQKVGGGGKGGGGSEQTIVTYYHFVDIAIAICHGEVSDIVKIWADADVIYDASNLNRLVVSDKLSVTPVVYGGETFMLIASETGGPDLTEFVPYFNVVISGFANALNNGTHQPQAVWADTAIDESYMLLDNELAVSEAAGASATLAQTVPARDLRRMTDIDIYKGTAVQTADPTMVASLGAANVPGYRNIAYVVIQNLALEAYGNRVPNLSFEVEADASKTVAAAIGDLIENAGLTASEYDTSEIFI